MPEPIVHPGMRQNNVKTPLEELKARELGQHMARIVPLLYGLALDDAKMVLSMVADRLSESAREAVEPKKLPRALRRRSDGMVLAAFPGWEIGGKFDPIADALPKDHLDAIARQHDHDLAMARATAEDRRRMLELHQAQAAAETGGVDGFVPELASKAELVAWGDANGVEIDHKRPIALIRQVVKQHIDDAKLLGSKAA